MVRLFCDSSWSNPKTTRQAKEDEAIKLPILVPLFVAITVLLIIFTVAIYHLQQQHITNDVRMIGSGKENQRISEVPGNDELTQLSRAINQMLEKISLIQLRYKSIVEDLTELICRFDPEGQITFMNPAFKRSIENTGRDLEYRLVWA